MGTDKGDDYEGDNLPSPPTDGDPETNRPSWFIIIFMVVAAAVYGVHVYYAKQNGTDLASQIAAQKQINAVQQQQQQANSPDNSDTVNSAASSHAAPAAVPNNQMEEDQHAVTNSGNPYSGGTSNSGSTTATPSGSLY